jgi:methyl-accepting chemotaxis protein
MEFSLKNKKISIKVLLALLITILFIMTGILFALYFHKSINNILINELKERGKILTKNLAANINIGIVTGDKHILDETIKEILNEKDVVSTAIIDEKGEKIIQKDNEKEKKVKIPEKIIRKVVRSDAPQVLSFVYDDLEFISISNPIAIYEKNKDCAIESLEEEEGKAKTPIKKGNAQIIFTLENTNKKLARIYNTVIIFIVLITSVGILLSLIFIKIIIKPIEDMVDISGKIADGDITKQVKKTAFIEFDGLSESINKISGRLREILNKVFSTSQEIKDATDSIRYTSGFLFEGSKEQSSSVDNTYVSIKGMDDKIKIIAENLKDLSSSAGLTSNSMGTMVSSIDALSKNATELSDSIENSSSSIIQMTSSIKEIAQNTDELSQIMNITTESVKEMDNMIHKITDISKEAYSLSEKVKTDSSELGLKSIEQMSESMDKIKESVEYSTSTIRKLGGTSSQIGEILTVIESVTEQTDLLALNAAILAAQAGKHGRGFAVVADEIKALANRNTASTKEITDIIRGIQEDVENSVKAVSLGRNNVEEGVKQTEAVVKAFEYIYQSANSSLRKANDIKNYSLSQSEQIIVIKKSIEDMAKMVFHVVKATNEQKTTSEYIMQTMERISKVTVNIKDTIGDQSGQSKRISKAINDITNSINMINESISKGSKEADVIVNATNNIKDIASKNNEYNNELSNVIKRLLELSQLLEDELKHFKLNNDKQD